MIKLLNQLVYEIAKHDKGEIKNYCMVSLQEIVQKGHVDFSRYCIKKNFEFSFYRMLYVDYEQTCVFSPLAAMVSFAMSSLD